MGTEPVEYCRAIETYLCQKNDGHLIRVVGPSFELVSQWESDGIPLKVALRGIDRYFERYYRKGSRRRPVRIDFCDADVRDVFDEWRRAVGVADAHTGAEPKPGRSLPAHLERAILKLTNARATGALPASADDLIDRVSRELDAARESARGVRGDARAALVARLGELDADLVRLAREVLDESARPALEQEADEELADFRERLAPDAYCRARDQAIDRLARERCGLPTLTYS